MEQSQAFMNGFHSASRNVFLVSSVAIGLYGFSETFKIEKSANIIKSLSLFIFLCAFFQGINTSYSMYKYIEYIKNKDNLPPHINMNVWYNYLLITSGYTLLLGIVITLAFIRFLNRILN